jgi:hypothetical protein
MRYIILLSCLLMAGCASPDISAFKQSSLALSSGLTDNQTSLVAAGKEIADKLGNPDNLTANVQALSEQGKKVEQLAAVLAAYASSVSVLSSTGTDGTDAVNILLSNVQTTVTSISGNSLTLPNEIGSLTSALGALQQQGANQRLYQIMQNVQPEVDSIATELGKLPGAEQLIVQGMATYLKSGRQDLVNYHYIYTNLQAQLAGIDALSGNALKYAYNNCRSTEVGCDYAALKKSHEKAISSHNDERIKVQSLMNVITPFEAAYQAWMKDVRVWETTMLTKSRTTAALAAAWKKDHQSIIVYLQTCSELNGIFASKCAAFSTSNLELFGILLGKAALAI